MVVRKVFVKTVQKEKMLLRKNDMRKDRNCVKYVGEKIIIALISRAYCRNTGGSESSDL